MHVEKRWRHVFLFPLRYVQAETTLQHRASAVGGGGGGGLRERERLGGSVESEKQSLMSGFFLFLLGDKLFQDVYERDGYDEKEMECVEDISCMRRT